MLNLVELRQELANLKAELEQELAKQEMEVEQELAKLELAIDCTEIVQQGILTARDANTKSLFEHSVEKLLQDDSCGLLRKVAASSEELIEELLDLLWYWEPMKSAESPEAQSWYTATLILIDDGIDFIEFRISVIRLGRIGFLAVKLEVVP